MENLTDLKAIWLSAKLFDLPASAEMVEMAKNYRNKGLRKKVILIVTALLLTVFMVVVFFIYNSTMLTTLLGEACIVIAGLILLTTNLRSIGRFYRFQDYNNKDFIQFLEQTRLNRIRYYKKTQVIGLCFSSVGSALYLVETVRENLVAGLIIYLFTGLSIGVTWLYVRPRSYKKRQAKLEEAITRLKKIADQFENKTI
jgi:hypothetical protein